VATLAFPGCAEVSMLMAKNRRQPPSIRGPREAGIKAGRKRTPPNCAGHCAVAGIAPPRKPALYRVLSLVQPPAAALVKSLPLPSDRRRLLASGRTLPEPRSAPQARPIARTKYQQSRY
jgi:hypothetical protein